MPEKENEVYIDTLVALTPYQELYDHLKEVIVDDYARSNGWSVQKADSIRSSLDYNYQDFKSMYYNVHSQYSTEELQAKIKQIRSLDPNLPAAEYPTLEEMILHNFENRIEWSCKRALKE